MSQHEYDSVIETLCLMRSPENKVRINHTIQQLENNHCVERNLVDIS